jgi:hypothetical protein
MLLTVEAAGESTDRPVPSQPLPPGSGPSGILAGKTPLTPTDLGRKVEGSYVTGLPLIDSDPDTGLGFGARAYWYWDGPRSDPFFAYTPYRHQVYAQLFATTNGFQEHTVDWDAPYLAGSPLRLRATASYIQNIAANYFGRGAQTLGALSLPAALRSFRSFDAYTAALQQLRPGKLAYTLYDKFWFDAPSLRTTLERDLFAGRVRVQAGLVASYVRVRDYSGTQTRGIEPATGQTVEATMGITRLATDCAAGRLAGCRGGIHDVLKLGVAFDTRDYEPDPNDGAFVDLTAEISSRALGSDFDYVRVTFAPRAFVSPAPSLTDAVLAARLVYSAQTAGTPFFAMNTLGFTDTDRYGLGGLWTLRGYKQDRFVGSVAAMVNVELRCTLFGFSAASQRFDVAAAPFFDTGRVFDRVPDFSTAGWRSGGGLGVHVAWNKATIVVIEYGVSSEDSGLYMDFGQQF